MLFGKELRCQPCSFLRLTLYHPVLPFSAEVPNRGDLMPVNLRWSWCNDCRTQVHDKYNALKSSWNHPLPQSMEKLSPMKPVTGAIKVGDHCSNEQWCIIGMEEAGASSSSLYSLSPSPDSIFQALSRENLEVEWQVPGRVQGRIQFSWGQSVCLP